MLAPAAVECTVACRHYHHMGSMGGHVGCMQHGLSSRIPWMHSGKKESFFDGWPEFCTTRNVVWQTLSLLQEKLRDTPGT